jgi:hypothetical protein
MFLVITIPLSVYVGKTFPPEKGVLLNKQTEIPIQILYLYKLTLSVTAL